MSNLAPSASRTSAAPHRLLAALFPCLATLTPHEATTNAEVVEEISRRVSCEVVPRSLRLMSSSIPEDHPVVLAGKALGRTCYGSPTMSDPAFLRVPSLKMGVGHSSRSHIADEYVYLHEIKEGIALYIALIGRLVRGAV